MSDKPWIGRSTLLGMSPEQRFWEKVDRRSDNECWPWLASVDTHGYAHLGFEKKMIRAHRFSFQIHYGNIPDGLCVCHHCDNPSCVNPLHLFLGTHKDNMLDMCAKGRRDYDCVSGEKQHKAKLTEEEVSEIRHLYSSGKHTQKGLGVIFGVWYSTIGRIVNRKTWKHV